MRKESLSRSVFELYARPMGNRSSAERRRVLVSTSFADACWIVNTDNAAGVHWVVCLHNHGREISVFDSMRGRHGLASAGICAGSAHHFALGQQSDGWSCGYRALHSLIQLHRGSQESSIGDMVTNAHNGSFQPREPPSLFFQLVWSLLELKSAMDASSLPDDPDYVFFREFRQLRYDDNESCTSAIEFTEFYKQTMAI